nr:helix-turn-helix transcriptional regulator [Clostridium cadaveris]
MESHVTLDQLSEIFHISGTQIKNSFKAVYGVSMYSYIRTQKMQSAALLLKKNNCKVIEIAGRFGYDNGSKFAKAFKDIMGVTPNEYRMSK